jgi:predicted ATP-dependent Lon-type protease
MTNLHPVEHGGDCPDAHACRIQRRWLTAYVHNAVTLAEMAIEKGAQSLLLPVSCRRQLFDLSDDMATKLDVEFYQDVRDALLKALAG